MNRRSLRVTERRDRGAGGRGLVYVRMSLSQRQVEERETRVPGDVRRRNQDARPLRALMRSMGKCETRECSRVRERRRRRRGQAVVPDDDGIAPLSIYYCLRGQATRRFGPHRTVTWTEQGVQKDKGLVQ